MKINIYDPYQVGSTPPIDKTKTEQDAQAAKLVGSTGRFKPVYRKPDVITKADTKSEHHPGEVTNAAVIIKTDSKRFP